MKTFKISGDTVWAGICCVALCTLIYGAYWVIQTSPTDEQVQAQIYKHGCKPTNQFVGKYADRLWVCKSGLMYKQDVFRQWAFDENRKS